MTYLFATPDNNSQTTVITLESAWRVRATEPEDASPGSQMPWIEAQVPGHVHLDLTRAGIIQDPCYRMGERSCAWVAETDWVYETQFCVEERLAGATYLRFNGLDT